MLRQKGKVYIGTSNIVVPGNKRSFPPAFRDKSRLHYYSSFFNTLEVNSSFYRTPMASTYKKWSLDVPADFQFSLKLSKEITHIKNLQGELSGIEHFIKAADSIGNKKGCLLIQFPGKISLEYFVKVEQIMQELQSHDEKSEWRKAVEFRNSSWYTGETYELLDEYGATIVLHDISKGKISEVKGKADFVYTRFHGPKGDYRDSYPDSFLKDKAMQINAWLAEGKDVYAYFNNTIGNAFENALSLNKMVNNKRGY